MDFIKEKAKELPVVHETDVCVVGGSATGVFAAVRAARLGARVAIVELMNSFGGVATNGLISCWHSFRDTERKKQIVAGLSEEVLSRMSEIDYNNGNADSHFFNPCELKYELDRILIENKVKIYLHTMYVGVCEEDDELKAIIIENKNGRSAIKARFFIDASGDGDICRDLGIEKYTNGNIQPPSYAFTMQGSDAALYKKYDTGEADVISILLCKYGKEFGLDPDWGWGTFVPGLDNIKMRANTHVFNHFCADADELTLAELEGRRHMHNITRMLRKYGDESQHYSVVSDPATIGIRETYHYRTGYQAYYLDILLGKKYEDNIMHGTYNIDIHDANGGIKFMHFDGTYNEQNEVGEDRFGNWREELGISKDIPVPTYYSLPFRVLVNEKYKNFIAAGRMINADEPSFGALRVMINLNQIGEAAGVAAYMALNENKSVQELDGTKVAQELAKGGSANLD